MCVCVCVCIRSHLRLLPRQTEVVETSAAKRAQEKKETEPVSEKINGAMGRAKKERDCQSQTNSEGSMCRLLLAYPRECQTQSSSSPQFKVVTRPLEFLILIASTGPRLQRRQRTGGAKSRPLLRKKRGRQRDKLLCSLPFCSSIISNRHTVPLSDESEEVREHPWNVIRKEIVFGGGGLPYTCWFFFAARRRLHMEAHWKVIVYLP